MSRDVAWTDKRPTKHGDTQSSSLCPLRDRVDRCRSILLCDDCTSIFCRTCLCACNLRDSCFLSQDSACSEFAGALSTGQNLWSSIGIDSNWPTDCKVHGCLSCIMYQIFVLDPTGSPWILWHFCSCLANLGIYMAQTPGFLGFVLCVSTLQTYRRYWCVVCIHTSSVQETLRGSLTCRLQLAF